MIRDSNCVYGFNIGEIYKITKTECDGINKIQIENKNYHGYVSEEHIQKVQFTKSDLKNGDIVTYRDGRIRILRDGCMIDEDGYIGLELDDYTEGLVNKKGVSKCDIVKVRRITGYETVFERKEEILDKAEKRYLRGVIRPFRDKVKGIEKHIRVFDSDKAFIRILSNQGTMTCLPDFEVDTMYKKMEAEREYTLEELRTIKE